MCEMSIISRATLENTLFQEPLKFIAHGHIFEKLRYVMNCDPVDILFWSRIYQQRNWTPLYITSKKGHDRIVTQLLKRGADVNYQDEVR